jgi:hypothetical protein
MSGGSPTFSHPGGIAHKFGIIVCLLAVASLSRSAAAPLALELEEHAERYQDAPMYIFQTGLSAPMISQLGPFTSYQVNVSSSGQNITGDAANEPSIAVDPTNRNKMSIGWRQFDSVSSNFRKAGYGYTTNGGTSWTFPGVLEEGVFRSDPVLAPDADGKFFYLSLQGDLYTDLWRSLTGGQSWTYLSPAFGGDKQWFTIDTTNSPGRGFQYQYWSPAGNHFPVKQFSRSTNGGLSWESPVSIPQQIVAGTLDVNSSGDLFFNGVDINDAGKIWCIRSTNAKNAAVAPTFDLATLVNMGGSQSIFKGINPGGSNGQPYLAIDRSGGTTHGNVYMLASLKSPATPNGTDVMFVRSTDGGQTFSAPKRINDDPISATASKWHWFGTFSVAPDGRLDAIWLDTRNAANNTDSQLFYSYSRDAGNTWSANVAVSQPFNPFLGYPNQNKMGDYMSIVSDLGGGNVAYTATFNGEEDIYYVRVAPPSVKLANLSTRARVLTGEQVLIAGFIVTGTDPKRVIIRGIGPSLSGVSGNLSDPTLELRQGSTALASNDNWKTKPDGSSQQAEVEATTIPPTNESESAIVMTLNPGTYTATLSGRNGGTGIGVVEVYDLDQAANSRLANISTRGFVDTDDNAMIAGLIAGQGETGATAQVLVRALGPSLSNSGVQGPLQDPTLALHDANGATIATNDNWKINDQTQQSQEDLIRSSTVAPSTDLEAAIVASLPPGPTTAIVRGKNNSTGVALVEVYNLP